MKKQKRGFALWEKEMLKAVSSLGGKTAHEKGVAYVFDANSARKASLASRMAKRAERDDRQLDLFENAPTSAEVAADSGVRGGS